MPDLKKYFLRYQADWILDESPTAMSEKSRRVGLTYAESYRSVERRIKLGTNHYFQSRDRESAREFVEYCMMWVHVFGAVAEDLGEQVIDGDKDLRAYVIRFANGAKIVALSSNPESLRSKGGDVTLDEFAFHEDQRRLLKAANASAKIWGHTLRIISTHNGEGVLFNRLIKEIREGKRRWSLHRVTLVDAVEQGLVEKIQKRDVISLEARQQFLADVRRDCVDQSEWDQEFMCIPGDEESSLLSYDLIQSCEEEDLKLYEIRDLPRTGQMYLGYDVGRSRDLSVAWVLELVGDVYWTRVVKRLAKTKYTPQEEFLNFAMSNPAIKRECIDKGLIGAMLAERQEDKWGYRAEGVQCGHADLAMPVLRIFEDRRIRIPAEAETRESLHKVKKIVQGNNVRFVAPHDEHGHSDEFWSIALALNAADDLKIPLPASSTKRPVGW